MIIDACYALMTSICSEVFQKLQNKAVYSALESFL